MMTFPKNSTSRVTGTRARAILPNKLDLNHWDYHELNGSDNGTDMVIEFIENDEFHNDKIECQIKGTANIEKMNTKKGISYPLEIKTTNYGLSCSYAFVLFLVDVNEEKVYYLPIQDYFNSNPTYFKKIETNNATINVHIPYSSLITDNDLELCKLALSVYVRTEPNKIIKTYKRELAL